MTRSFPKTLKLKVRSESYRWLDAAGIEVNEVFNYCNEISFATATRTDLKRKDRAVRFCGKSFRVFEIERLDGVKWGQGCFAQDAVGDWWLCLPMYSEIGESIAPNESVGIDLGIKDVAVTSDGERLEAGRFYRKAESQIGMLQRRGHRRQAKRLHRTVARRRRDACHKFSRKIVDRYQNILIGDVSSPKLAKTRMAKSVLDSGWGMLRRMLQYKGEHAGRSVMIVDERDTSRVCASCGAPFGPSGLRHLVVRTWQCAMCGDWHDRDVNAARNILGFGSRCWTSVSGNESLHEQLLAGPEFSFCARPGRSSAHVVA